MPEYRITGQITGTRELGVTADSEQEAREKWNEYFNGEETTIYAIKKVNDDN